MSEENNDGGTPPAKPEFEPITSQADLDRVIRDRITRERGKFADYDDLRAKAARLDELEAKSKTELEREREARQQAERERDDARSEALRAQVAADKGVPASALTGTTKEELEAAADALIAWSGDQTPPVKTPPPPAKALKSGSVNGNEETGDAKTRAAAAVRALRGGD